MHLTRHVAFTLAAAVLAAPPAQAARSAAGQALYERAVAECNGPSYPSGSRPQINYSAGWFTCKEPKTDSRK